jgi:hypothetical protein
VDPLGHRFAVPRRIDLLSVGEPGGRGGFAADYLIGDGAGAGAQDRAGEVDPEIRPRPGGEGRAEERAGFIEAPVTGPPNRASSPITPPIAIAAAAPAPRVSVATAMITNIRAAVITSS